MAEFRIDSLIIEWNGTNYNLSGVCNSNIAGSATNITGTYDQTAQDIFFNAGAGAAADKYAFLCTGVSFSGYGDAEMAGLTFGNVAYPANAKRKAKSIARDTKFPPPGDNGLEELKVFSAHGTFSAQFRMNSLTMDRINPGAAGTAFQISVELYYLGGAFAYTVVSADFVEDSSYPGTWVIALVVSEQAGPGPAGALQFTVVPPAGISIEPANFDPVGLAVLVKEDTRPWSDVNTKKALFYILN